MGAPFIGLDVGGTFLKGALVSAEGEVRARLHQPIARDSAEALLGQLAAATRQLETGSGAGGGVGVGLPGIVNRRTGKLYRPPNLPAIDGIDAADELTRRTGRRAVAENDANAAALAEAWKGAGPRRHDRAAGDARHRHRRRPRVRRAHLGGHAAGTRARSATSRWIRSGVRCGCGSWGCVETFAGAPGWARRAEEALAHAPHSRLHGLGLDPAVIVEAARAGDEVALGVVDGAAARAGGGHRRRAEPAEPRPRGHRGRGGRGRRRSCSSAWWRRRASGSSRTCSPTASFRLAELGADAGVVGAARAAMLAFAGLGPCSSRARGSRTTCSPCSRRCARSAAAATRACWNRRGLLFESPRPEEEDADPALRAFLERNRAELFAIPGGMSGQGPMEDAFEQWDGDEFLLAFVNGRVAVVVACPDAERAREARLRRPEGDGGPAAPLRRRSTAWTRRAAASSSAARAST